MFDRTFEAILLVFTTVVVTAGRGGRAKHKLATLN